MQRTLAIYGLMRYIPDMTKPATDMSIHPEHLSLLREVMAGCESIRSAVIPLVARGLVDMYMHHVEINAMSHVALARLYVGASVRITRDYCQPLLWGREGKVHDIRVFGNGGVVIDVLFQDLDGHWMFYEIPAENATKRERAISLGHIMNVCPADRVFRLNARPMTNENLTLGAWSGRRLLPVANSKTATGFYPAT